MRGAGAAQRQSDPPAEYDPETETDPLIRQYIALRPPSHQKNDPVVRGASGHLYPVWSVVLNYRAVDGDVRRTLENYGADLTPEHLWAAVRFADRYPHIVLPYVEAALDPDYGRHGVPGGR